MTTDLILFRSTRCPGEPEPRKRQKKGEGGAAADGSPSALATLPLVSAGGTQANMDRFELGGALTFHLIEVSRRLQWCASRPCLRIFLFQSLFVMANPAIPGLDYWTYRNLLHNAGGSSREMEIAAEVRRRNGVLLARESKANLRPSTVSVFCFHRQCSFVLRSFSKPAWDSKRVDRETDSPPS